MENVRRQEGVMLIEAMIGILIFSIGILALIGMQATAVKNTTDARYRSEASFLASRIVAQIWLDRANIDSYKDSNASAYVPRDDWRVQVQNALPGIDIATTQRVPSIDVDTGTGNRVTVIIYWMQAGETQQRQFQMIGYVNGA
jgi:type IV pilus assembly protein PilV